MRRLSALILACILLLAACGAPAEGSRRRLGATLDTGPRSRTDGRRGPVGISRTLHKV